jgi:hypothetical protein
MVEPFRRDVHRPDEPNPRGEDALALDARDCDEPVLERLTQRFEGRAMEFTELVEEEDAPVGEAGLAWARPRAAAHNRGRGGRMVRGPEGWMVE